MTFYIKISHAGRDHFLHVTREYSEARHVLFRVTGKHNEVLLMPFFFNMRAHFKVISGKFSNTDMSKMVEDALSNAIDCPGAPGPLFDDDFLK